MRLKFSNAKICATVILIFSLSQPVIAGIPVARW